MQPGTSPHATLRVRQRRAMLGLAVGLLLGAGGWADEAQAQLEVLLRGVEPQVPHEGSCARYEFTSEEPDGTRRSEFVACVESVPESGPILLRLQSGDSLQIRIAVRPQLFRDAGADLTDNIVSVERRQKGEVQLLTPEDWRRHPALAPAAPLPVLADSSLGEKDIVLASGDTLRAQGRFRHEARSEERKWSGVDVTSTEDRTLTLWSDDRAPILGVVWAEARVRSERIFSEPIPGVPERGPRVMRYSLKLLEILQLPGR